MKEQLVNRRYRQFLLLLAGFVFVGTGVQLWFTEHFGNSVQLIPFILAGLGISAVAVVLLWARPVSVEALRVVMVLVVLGSLFGIFQHIEHNIEFALEMQPDAQVSEVFFEALKGANPLLAPGILLLAAILAIAATYCHPSLETAIDILD